MPRHATEPSGEDWHLKREVVVRDSNHFATLRVAKCGMTWMVFVFLGGLFADGGGLARAESELQSAARGAAANCAVQRAAGVVNGKVFGPRTAGNATMRMQLRASARRGCGPHDSASRPFPFIILIMLPFDVKRLRQKPPR